MLVSPPRPAWPPVTCAPLYPPSAGAARGEVRGQGLGARRWVQILTWLMPKPVPGHSAPPPPALASKAAVPLGGQRVPFQTLVPPHPPHHHPRRHLRARFLQLGGGVRCFRAGRCPLEITVPGLAGLVLQKDAVTGSQSRLPGEGRSRGR